MRAQPVEMAPCERKIALLGQIQNDQGCQYRMKFQCAEDMQNIPRELNSKKPDTVAAIQK